MPKPPDALIQELRNMLALHAREMLMETKADGAKTDKQCVIMEKVFHGSEQYYSVLDAMCEAKGIYSALFDRHELEVNREGNEHRKGGVMLELKPIFHNNAGKKRVRIFMFNPP